jgi:hypothetical protein
MLQKKNIILTLSLFVFACDKADITDLDEQHNGNSGWLVDTTKMTGTSLIEVFPVVTEPIYTPAGDAPDKFLSDRAVVFMIDKTVFIYPFWMMGVEVVNDQIGDTFFSVTYCPKTRTTYVINRYLDGNFHTFRASGLLYQDNLVYYDLETGSFWSQMLFKSIKGPNSGLEPVYINSFETTYGIAKELFPEAIVFTDYIGSGDDRTTPLTSSKSLPLSNNLVLALPHHNNKPGFLPVVNYNTLDEMGIIKSGNILIVYSKPHQYINAFVSIPGVEFEFKNDFPSILTDNEGNTWDAFGHAISGPREGERLNGTVSYLAFWWAWEGIFKDFDFIGY